MDSNRHSVSSPRDSNGGRKRGRDDESSTALPPSPFARDRTSESNKRIRLENDEMDGKSVDPSSIASVKEKNKAMALDLKEKNRRIAFLEGKCKTLYKESVVSESAFRCINRNAKQLMDDLEAIQRSDQAAIQAENIENASSSVETPLKAAGHDMDLIRLWKEEIQKLNVPLPEWFGCIGSVSQEQDENITSEKSDNIESAIEEWMENASNRIKKLFSRIIISTHQDKAYSNVLLEEKQRVTAESLLYKDQMEQLKKEVAMLKGDLEQKEKERHQACRDYDRLVEKYEKRERNLEAETETCNIQERTKLAVMALNNERVQYLEKLIIELYEEAEVLNNKLKIEQSARAKLDDDVVKLRAHSIYTYRRDSELRDGTSERVAQIEKEKKNLNDELVKYRHKVEDIEKHVHEKWKKKLDKLQSEADKARSLADELSRKNAVLREKLAAAPAYVDQNNGIKNNFLDSIHEKTVLKKTVDRLLAERKEAEDRKQDHETAVVNDTIKALECRVSFLQRAYDAVMTSERNDAIVAELTAQREAFQAKTEEYRVLLAEKERALTESQAKMANFQRENDFLIAEIEEMNSEVASCRREHNKMVMVVQDKQVEANKLRAQAMRAENAKTHYLEELNGRRMQLNSLKAAHRHQVSTINSMKEAMMRNTDVREESRVLIAALKKQVESLEYKHRSYKESSAISLRAQTVRTELREQRVLDLERRLRDQFERYQKREEYMQRMNEHLQQVAATVNQSTMSDVERLELEDLQKTVKCPVCQDRRKDVVITKCCHTFCKECVDLTIKGRNRKCPSCKKNFGQDDVKTVYF